MCVCVYGMSQKEQIFSILFICTLCVSASSSSHQASQFGTYYFMCVSHWLEEVKAICVVHIAPFFFVFLVKLYKDVFAGDVLCVASYRAQLSTRILNIDNRLWMCMRVFVRWHYRKLAVSLWPMYTNTHILCKRLSSKIDDPICTFERVEDKIKC